MTRYWELELLGTVLLVNLVVLVWAIGCAWYRDRQRWKSMPRHLGSTYDASSPTRYRPNIDVRRVR